MRSALLLCLLGFPVAFQAGGDIRSPASVPVLDSGRLPYQTALTTSPLVFEKNLGQSAPQFDFLARAGQYTFLLSPSGVKMVAGSDAASAGFEILFERRERPARSIGVKELPGVVNYFLSPDPLLWHRGIPTYAEVHYPNTFRNIDLVYRNNGARLEYDFVLNPGSDPRHIRMRLAGADQIELCDQDLVLKVQGRELRIRQPKAFQSAQGVRTDIPVRWAIEANVASFVLGDYDRSRTLVIDPVVSYVNLVPGEARVRVDRGNNVYIGTAASDGAGPIEVKKIGPSGAIVYDTFLGRTDDNLRLGAADRMGNAYVIGGVGNGQCGIYFDKLLSCGDAIVMQLDETGNLAFSISFGGSAGEMVSAIAIDENGRLYVTGPTTSADFPIVNAAQASPSTTVGIGPCGATSGSLCQYDAFVAAIDPSVPGFVYSTYLGGTDLDYPYAITVDSQAGAYLTGFTQSLDFPTTQPTHGGGRGFVAKYDAAGSIRFSKYLGGNYVGTAIGTDPSGSIVVAGHESPGWNGFLRKISPDGKESSTWLIESKAATNVSGNPTKIWGMTIDDRGEVYLTGHTEAYDLPLMNPIQFQPGGYLDAFVMKFSPSGQVLFSTYLGGSFSDQGLSVAVDSDQAIYIAGITYSIDFPLLDESSVTVAGSGSGFVAKIDVGPSIPLQVNPNQMVFPPQLKGTTVTQEMTLTNVAVTPITLSSVAFDASMAWSDRFAVASKCGAQIPPGESCKVLISFSPQYSGEAVTTLNILSSAGRLRLGVRGVSAEPGPAARISPQTIVGHAVPGTTVHEGLIRIVNFGMNPLILTDISTTAQFSSSNDCVANLSTYESCTVYLSFSPTTSGATRGSVTISSNDVWGPQTWYLDGFGEDFTISSPQSTASVTQGGSAEYPLRLAGNAMTPEHAVTVALSCSGLPSGAECNFADSQLVVGSAGASTTLAITTSASRVAAGRGFNASYASLWLVGLVIGIFVRPRSSATAGLLLLISVVLTVTACGFDSNDTISSSAGTPLGIHTIVVNATAGSLQRSTTLNLTVN